MTPTDRTKLADRLDTLQDHYSVSGQLGPENSRIFAEAAAALRSPEAADAGAVAWQFFDSELGWVDHAAPTEYDRAVHGPMRINTLFRVKPPSPTAAGIAAPPAASADAVREALEHVTELLVDTWSTAMECDPEKEIAVANARAALTAPVAGADAGMRERESIARIIDPHSFLPETSGDEVFADMVEQSKQLALRKADRIRALPASGEAAERTALEDIALLDEADGHELTRDHALQAVAIATKLLGKHPSQISAERAARKSKD